jgi:hypothetical protein
MTSQAVSDGVASVGLKRSRTTNDGKSPMDLDMGKALIVLNVPEQVEFWFLDTHDLRDISDI